MVFMLTIERQKRLAAAVALGFGLLFPIMAYSAKIEKIRFSHGDELSRLVLDIDEKVVWDIDKEHSDKQGKTVIRLDETQLAAQLPAAHIFTGSRLQKLTTKSGTGSSRQQLQIIVKHFPNSYEIDGYALPGRSQGMRLVLDLSDRLAPVKILDRGKKLRPIFIAIDAGHGGIDPGAISAKGLKEKDIVLNIAFYLQQLLLREAGFYPIMTRADDRILDLSQRMEISRRAAVHDDKLIPADLFVSIHADSFTSISASGASIYVLSPSHMGDAIDQHLRDHKERAPLRGNIDLEEQASRHQHLPHTLLDLAMNDGMYEAMTAGPALLDEIGKISRLHYEQVKLAGFAVLKPADVPALLIETGFMSNPGDAQRLATRRFQKLMAKAVFNGIKRYFYQNPPAMSIVSQAGDRNSSKRPVTIRKLEIEAFANEKIIDIAKRYGISARSIYIANKTVNSILTTNRRLIIPVAATNVNKP